VRRVRRVLPYLLLVVVAAGYGYTRAAGGGDGDGAGGSSAAGVVPVLRVVDGDTLLVARGGAQERVRLIGVDTPETVKPDTPVQCFGRKASAFTHALLDGRRVRLVTDAEARDRFGRLLAYVYRAGDGLFVNAELVRRGYAVPLTIPPNVRFAQRFRTLAAEARRAGRGLWSACER
jgi:micrococcal nuclease